MSIAERKYSRREKRGQRKEFRPPFSSCLLGSSIFSDEEIGDYWLDEFQSLPKLSIEWNFNPNFPFPRWSFCSLHLGNVIDYGWCTSSFPASWNTIFGGIQQQNIIAQDVNLHTFHWRVHPLKSPMRHVARRTALVQLWTDNQALNRQPSFAQCKAKFLHIDGGIIEVVLLCAFLWACYKNCCNEQHIGLSL